MAEEEIKSEKAATGTMLVHGAGQVARAKHKGALVESKAATGVAEHLSEGLAKTFQRRNKEFNEIMKTQLSKEGLTDEEWQKMYKKLKRRRGGYVYLNKKQRMDFERETLEEAEDFKKNEADREEIADIVTDENNEIEIKDINNDLIEDIVTGKKEPTKDENGRPGYSLKQSELQEFVQEDEQGNPKLASYKEAWGDDRFTVSEDGKYKSDKFGNKYPNNDEGYSQFVRASKLDWIRKARETGEKVLHIDSQTGKREYLTPDEAEALLTDEEKFVSMDEIKDHIKGAAKNPNLENQLTANFTSGSEKAKNLKQGDDINFNWQDAGDRYEKLINKEDPYKLATKKYVGDTSFKDDLTEKLQTMDYKELGLKDEHIKKLDPTPKDGKVTPEDANVITNKIMGNEKLLKGLMKNYFTLYEAREFKKNIPANLKQNQQEGQLETVTNEDLGSGSVGEDGIFINN
jgi:hypothetical protein